MSAIGKGLAIYLSDNRDQYPWLVSDNRWDAATGEGRLAEPSEKTRYNVSALLFLLIRQGQAPGIFCCASTADCPDANTKAPTQRSSYRSDFNWDFSPFQFGGVEHISYSYQAPMKDRRGGWGSGVTADSNAAALVILADRTPTYSGKIATFNWAAPGGADPKTGMSQNHTGGEMINLLYADLHVGESVGRADAGIRRDSVYSAAGLGADGNALDTSQGPGSLKLDDHRSPLDSFLLGPKKMEN